MSGRLEGKVAAITGAASGFGEGAARRFVAEGAKVALGDIQDERGQAVADELGDAAVYRHCDVTSEDDVAGLVDAAVDVRRHEVSEVEANPSHHPISTASPS